MTSKVLWIAELIAKPGKKESCHQLQRGTFSIDQGLSCCVSHQNSTHLHG